MYVCLKGRQGSTFYYRNLRGKTLMFSASNSESQVVINKSGGRESEIDCSGE